MVVMFISDVLLVQCGLKHSYFKTFCLKKINVNCIFIEFIIL